MSETTAVTRELGARLRDCRERVGLTALEVATTLGWTTSKMSRVENGQRLPDPIDMAMFLGCCGVPEKIAKPLLDLAQDRDDGFWVRPHRKQLPDRLLTLVMNETTASSIVSFEPLLVPGLVQTENYAAEAVRGVISIEPGDIEPRVQARLARQSLLSRPYPPQAVFFLNEAVLRYPVGGPQVMHEQLVALILATAQSNVKVRVIPASAGPHAGMRGSFVLMEYRDRRPVVWLEGEAFSTLVEDREVVETYRMIRSELYRIALDEEESRSLFADLADEYDRVVEERASGGGAN
jgi:transcriptional regulator with XRE-family HTH domain